LVEVCIQYAISGGFSYNPPPSSRPPPTSRFSSSFSEATDAPKRFKAGQPAVSTTTKTMTSTTTKSTTSTKTTTTSPPTQPPSLTQEQQTEIKDNFDGVGTYREYGF
jgi:hypothetical protein